MGFLINLINASIWHFSFESHVVWNIDENIFQKSAFFEV
jgi:hypothetical protein